MANGRTLVEDFPRLSNVQLDRRDFVLRKTPRLVLSGTRGQGEKLINAIDGDFEMRWPTQKGADDKGADQRRGMD